MVHGRAAGGTGGGDQREKRIMHFKATIKINGSQLSVRYVYFRPTYLVSRSADRPWINLQASNKKIWNLLMTTKVKYDTDTGSVLAFGRRMSMEYAAHKLYVEDGEKLFDVEFEAKINEDDQLDIQDDPIHILTKMEGHDGAIGLVAYFFGEEPSHYQLESIYIAAERRTEGFRGAVLKPVEVQDEVSTRAGLRRWVICTRNN